MEEKILTILINIQSDICEIKQDVKELKVRMDKLEQRMDKLEERMDRLEERVDRLEVRVDNIEANMKEMDQKHDRNYDELRKQRIIDSNNIAQILNMQTKLIQMFDKKSA